MSFRKTVMAAMLIGATLTVQAEIGQADHNDTVDQLIVALKTPQSNQTPHISQSENPLERLSQVIKHVQNKKLNLRVTNHSDTIRPALQTMRPEKVIMENTMVVALGSAISRADANRLAANFAEEPEVDYAEPDSRMVIQDIPNDPRFAEQWGYSNVGGGARLSAAWDKTKGTKDIVVAVIDTGYVPHADLLGNLVVNALGQSGYDFVDNVIDARDPGDGRAKGECGGQGARNSSWHGSHVAGTIGAVSNNSTGVAGISWNGRILPVRVMGKCDGYTSDIISGMLWAAGFAVSNTPRNQHPAQVLNLSIGGPASKCSSSYIRTIKVLREKGVNVVVAAGNDAIPVTGFEPANCPGVISVAANDINGKMASFSNYGPDVTILAPGSKILSTVDSGQLSPEGDSYAMKSGTSMATPHVSGTVALMLAINPKLTPDQIQTILQTTARDFPSTSKCTKEKCGGGLLDAGSAVKASLAP